MIIGFILSADLRLAILRQHISIDTGNLTLGPITAEASDWLRVNQVMSEAAYLATSLEIEPLDWLVRPMCDITIAVTVLPWLSKRTIFRPIHQIQIYDVVDLFNISRVENQSLVVLEPELIRTISIAISEIARVDSPTSSSPGVYPGQICRSIPNLQAAPSS